LAAPARALAIYERIGREMPSSRVAAAAERRAVVLRDQVGEHGEHAREGAEFAALIADAGRFAAAESGGSSGARSGSSGVRTSSSGARTGSSDARTDPASIIARGIALADADWPGAPDAALWLADWLRGIGRSDDARARYAIVVARWPAGHQAASALRGEAATAIDMHDWDAAELLVGQLPSIAPEDRVLRDELADQVAQGRRRDHLYIAAWIAVGLVLAGLLASLIEASVRAGTRPSFAPPIEVLFLGPVAAVIIAISFTAHRAIAPAVAIISVGGLVCAWLSGAALDRLRSDDRPIRARAIVHVIACLVAVVALCYIAIMRDGLLDLLIETVRVGPEA
jgi:hypothetical protein